MSRGSPTVSCYRSGPSSGVDRTSSPTTMEEDTDDDLLDYELSPARNGMEVNAISYHLPITLCIKRRKSHNLHWEHKTPLSRSWWNQKII
jgi:hypothetical protein